MLLNTKYFQTNDTISLARDLIGKHLVRASSDGMAKAYLISEVEAYDGFLDKASHARFGKTPRNQVMFEAGGLWYVYLCYGIHWMLNIVTGNADYPAAILIRGVDNVFGPGKVTKLLQINRGLNGKLAQIDSALWIEDRGYQPAQIIATSRIGINYAEEYRTKPWRFVLGK